MYITDTTSLFCELGAKILKGGQCDIFIDIEVDDNEYILYLISISYFVNNINY